MHIRTLSVGVVHGISMAAFAISTKAFPHLMEWLHFSGLNYYFAAVTLAMTVWGSLKIEATDDLSLVEIERLYHCKSANFKKSEKYGSTDVFQVE